MSACDGEGQRVMVSEFCRRTPREAFNQLPPLDALDALNGTDVEDRIRQVATNVYTALIEAEMTSTMGAGPHERSEACVVGLLRKPVTVGLSRARC